MRIWNKFYRAYPPKERKKNALESPGRRESPDACIVRCFVIILIAAFFGGCAAVSEKTAGKPEIANPASVNCIKSGGRLSIQKRGDGGEYGVCVFEGNRQCEEWALLRGECSRGGRNISDYENPAARYCVVTGGLYDILEACNTDGECGECTFDNGRSCDALDYYNGRCPRNE